MFVFSIIIHLLLRFFSLFFFFFRLLLRLSLLLLSSSSSSSYSSSSSFFFVLLLPLLLLLSSIFFFMNVVEWFWAQLKKLLDDRAPAGFEKRGAFLVRLRRTVQCMNENLREEMLEKCMDQHKRADEILFRQGGKTSF